jgi:hypothetical protein
VSFGLGIVHDDGDGDDSTNDFYGHVDLVYGCSWLRFVAEIGDAGAPVAAVGARFATRHISVDLGLGVIGSDLVSAPTLVFGLTARP